MVYDHFMKDSVSPIFEKTQEEMKMGNLTHMAARTAAGFGIDRMLKKVNKSDRERKWSSWWI